MAQPADLDRDFQMLETELKRLEAEYTMFFAGQLPRPPWETRSRVEALLKRYERSSLDSYADRFRLTTLQARFTKFSELWDRALRTRDEGRPGPMLAKRRLPAAESRGDQIFHVAVFADPMKEIDKLHELYDRLADARRHAGEGPVPFHKFAELIRNQVAQLRSAGSPEVAFRVSLKGGKVSFTARALKGAKGR